MRINKKTVNLVITDQQLSHKGVLTGKPLIYTYISAICNNERYIAVRWTSPEEIDFDRIREHDFSTAKYYLIDSTNDALYGPFDTEADFLQQCEELSIGNLSAWIDVLDMPNVLGDKYYDW